MVIKKYKDGLRMWCVTCLWSYYKDGMHVDDKMMCETCISFSNETVGTRRFWLSYLKKSPYEIKRSDRKDVMPYL